MSSSLAPSVWLTSFQLQNILLFSFTSTASNSTHALEYFLFRPNQRYNQRKSFAFPNLGSTSQQEYTKCLQLQMLPQGIPKLYKKMVLTFLTRMEECKTGRLQACKAVPTGQSAPMWKRVSQQLHLVRQKVNQLRRHITQRRNGNKLEGRLQQVLLSRQAPLASLKPVSVPGCCNGAQN